MAYNPTPAETEQQMREWRINDLLRGAQQAHVFAHGVRKAEDAVRVVALCDEAGQPASVRDAAQDFCETPNTETADAFVRVAVATVMGSISTPAKAAASRANGKRGGRPRKSK